MRVSKTNNSTAIGISQIVNSNGQTQQKDNTTTVLPAARNISAIQNSSSQRLTADEQNVKGPKTEFEKRGLFSDSVNTKKKRRAPQPPVKPLMTTGNNVENPGTESENRGSPSNSINKENKCPAPPPPQKLTTSKKLGFAMQDRDKVRDEEARNLWGLQPKLTPTRQALPSPDEIQNLVGQLQWLGELQKALANRAAASAEGDLTQKPQRTLISRISRFLGWIGLS